jgi:hypothetical protein
MKELIKASESSSNDIQLEIENKTEFDNENHIVNDNIIEHDNMAKNGNQDSDIVNGIDSYVDANESQNELEVNNKDINAEGERNKNDENDSKDDDEEDDDESDDDDDNESDDDNENNDDTDSDGKKTEKPSKIKEDVSCRRIITALKVRGNGYRSSFLLI